MSRIMIICFFITLTQTHCHSEVSGDITRLRLPILEEGHYLSPVYTFLGNYFDKLVTLKSKKEQLAMLKTHRVELKINDISFESRKESLPLILQMITPDIPLMIRDQEKIIQVFWMVNENKDLIELVLPKQYDFLLEKDKKELTDLFQEELEKFQYVYTEEDHIYEFESVKTINNLYADLGEIYQIPQMKSGRYLQIKGGQFEYILNERMGEESLLNLFSHADQMNRKNILNINMNGYDKNFKFSYTLDRLCAFMKAQNCKTFLGIETIDREYTGTVLYVNQLLGYKHLLHFRFPNTAFFKENDVIEVKMYPYIPISNIEKLYDESDK